MRRGRRQLVRGAALLLLGMAPGGASAEVCDTLSGSFTVSFAAATPPGADYSHGVAGVVAGDMLLARVPTAADVRREAFVAPGAGRVAGIVAEVPGGGALADLLLERGVVHTLEWPHGGACAIVGNSAAFSLVNSGLFFTRDTTASVTRVLIPASFEADSLQYRCQNTALGLGSATIYVARQPTARLLASASTTPDAVFLRAPLEAAVAFADTLVLRVEEGYMGPEGAGFAQRVGAGGAWVPGSSVRAELVAGSTLAQASRGAHMVLLLAREELRTAADWADIVCGATGAGLAHASYTLCRGAGGVEPANGKVLDAAVVPLWRDDACALLRPRAQVSSVSNGGLVAFVPAEAAGPGVLWGYPALASTRGRCVPGVAASEQTLPCRWPDGMPSPFPVNDGTAGPFFFDQVLVPGRGLLLVCVGAGGAAAHAHGLHTAPNAPADAHMFAVGEHLFAGRAPAAGRTHACPGGAAYTQTQGVVEWTPLATPAADDDLWLYSVFMLGDSDACAAGACDAAAVQPASAAYLAAERPVSSLALFAGTRFDLAAPIATPVHARRALALPARMRRARAHVTRLHDAQAGVRGVVPPRRSLLAIAPGPDAAGSVVAQDMPGATANSRVEHAVCRAGQRKHCIALRVLLGAVAQEDYCMSESALIEKVRPRIEALVSGRDVVVVSITREDLSAVCYPTASSRRLLADATSREMTVKVVMTDDHYISKIIIKQQDLDDINARGIALEGAASASSIIKVAADDTEYQLETGSAIVSTRTGSSNLGTLAVVAIISGSVAFVLVLFVAWRIVDRRRRTKISHYIACPPTPTQAPPADAPAYTPSTAFPQPARPQYGQPPPGAGNGPAPYGQPPPGAGYGPHTQYAQPANGPAPYGQPPPGAGYGPNTQYARPAYGPGNAPAPYWQPPPGPAY